MPSTPREPTAGGSTKPDGRLYVVATPLGNLDDITLRAARVLGDVDRVLAEDTRRTGRLLQHLGHKKPTISVHEHNERGRIPQVIGWLGNGENLALVSDAGTPGISDPGFPLVRAVVEAGFRVVPIPGPSALTTAACAAGLPTDQLHFLGFLPTRKGRRRTVLKEVSGLRGSLVLFVSPHRLCSELQLLVEVLGPERKACICRELTKLHEEFDRGSLAELEARWALRKVRGELTLIVAPISRQDKKSQRD